MMMGTSTRFATLVFATAAALVSAQQLEPNADFHMPLADDEAQLAAALRDIDAEDIALSRVGRARSSADRITLLKGAVNLFRPFPRSSASSMRSADSRCPSFPTPMSRPSSRT